MIPPKDHNQEAERLKDLESYYILDSMPDSDFDYLTSIASKICGTPISLVSLIDNKRQWFKSHHGLSVTETAKEYAFCAHAINENNNILIVEDARKDERFHDNPLVTGDPHVIFYAGVPLVSEDGFPLGTLCVIDNMPKTLTQNQIDSLRALSNQVVNLLVLRKKKRELEQSLKEIRNKNRELEQFAFIASHDLREPLNTVTSFVEILRENHKENLSELEEKSLQYIYGASNRMKELLQGLLGYSRIGKKSEINKINCTTLVKSVVKDMNRIIKKSQSKIRIGELPIIYGYKAELEFLFRNLLGNAIKFAKPTVIPDIEITAEKLETLWKFTVKDNGIGINSKHKEKIFIIFQVLNDRDKYGGTGIGLAYCRRIAELHQGDIWVDSKLGIGSEFQFTINENLKTYEEDQ